MADRIRRTGLKSADFALIMITLGMTIFGVIMVFSASYYWSIDQTGNPYHFLLRDIILAVAGFGIMVVLMIVDYHRYRKIAPWLVLVCIILLVLTVFTPLGEERNGATRWLNIGITTILPGEISKLCVILFVAAYLSVSPKKVNKPSSLLLLIMLAAIFGGLIMLQPNMSTAITIVAIILIMMFVAGLKIRYIFGLGALGAAGMCVLIFSDQDGYRLKRVTSFLDPFADPLGDGYQVVQSLMALGSGGLGGLGLGKSIQKNLYLPEPQTDFILAIIGEELGYIVIILLMLAYLFMIWRGIKIAIAAPDRFGMLLATGVTAMIAIQVMLNVAVVTSSMPPTGVTLPFISYGGSALCMFMGSMGILLNVSRHAKDKIEED